MTVTPVEPVTPIGGLRSRLEELARQAAASEGLELGWLELKGHVGSRVVRVFLDRPEGDVGILDCERVTERLSLLLDASDPIDGAYTLEVSSPGLDRPLFDEKDYERFSGRLARLKTKELWQGRRRILGRLRGVKEGAVRIELEREPGGETLSVPLSVVESGRLEVEITMPNQDSRRSRGGKRV